jgi:peptide/nickel transport system permease protein
MSGAGIAAAVSHPSRVRRWLRRYGLALVGAAIIGFWLLAAVLAPVLLTYDPDFVEVANRLQAPSAAHWLGTDVLGRDVFARVIAGSRISLAAGFSVVTIGAVFGTVLASALSSARCSAASPPMRAAGRRRR